MKALTRNLLAIFATASILGGLGVGIVLMYERMQVSLVAVFAWAGLPAWPSHFVWWFAFGLLGVLVYRFIAQGPANPFGEPMEKNTFWLILCAGFVGFAVAIWSAFDRVYKEVLPLPPEPSPNSRWSRFDQPL